MLRDVPYLCTRCREKTALRMKTTKEPRRAMSMTCPKCRRRARFVFFGRRPLTGGHRIRVTS